MVVERTHLDTHRSIKASWHWGHKHIQCVRKRRLQRIRSGEKRTSFARLDPDSIFLLLYLIIHQRFLLTHSCWKEQGVQAKHGMSPGTSGCTESHYGTQEERGQRQARGRAQQKNEMKELQMRDFPVSRINQPTMKSAAQTPRLWTGGSSTQSDWIRLYTHVSASAKQERKARCTLSQTSCRKSMALQSFPSANAAHKHSVKI